MESQAVTSVTVRYNDGSKKTFNFQQQKLARHIIHQRSDKRPKGKTVIYEEHEVRWTTPEQEIKGS